MTYLDKAALKVVGTRPIRPDGVDKVIGRAAFGADMTMPGMLWGKVKRSPHAHARIVSIDTSKALKLAGVKAVVTADDFPDIPSEEAFVGEVIGGNDRLHAGQLQRLAGVDRDDDFPDIPSEEAFVGEGPMNFR